MARNLLIICAWILVTTSICLVAQGYENNGVIVSVQGSTSIAKTDANFICANLDWWPSTKCDYGYCPWGNSSILNLDLENKILRNAMKAFDNIRLRLGGSLDDQVIYDVGNADLECIDFTKSNTSRFQFDNGCLRMDRWDKLAQFFNETGAKVTFGLNVVLGKINTTKDDGIEYYVGHWNPANAQDFIQYNLLKGYNIDAYELGNELCGIAVLGPRIEAKQYAKDMIQLKQILELLYPDPITRPKVTGPAGFFDEEWFNTFLQESGPFVVDRLTHHIYNLGGGDDPDLIYKIQDPYFLTQIAETYKQVSKTVNQFGPWSQAWVGESGGAFNSGSKEVSNTFADGFWYLDNLGMTSTFNHKVFCRQTLIGGSYGLLDTTTFVPNPDFYGAVLWDRLMGTNVLGTTHNGSPYLRAYTHCSKKPGGGVSVLLINMSNSTSFNVRLVNDFNLFATQGLTKRNEEVKQREEYHLTPEGGNIQSRVVLLNGEPLKLTESSDIPEMKPKLVNPSSPIEVASYSFVFAFVPNFPASACEHSGPSIVLKGDAVNHVSF